MSEQRRSRIVVVGSLNLDLVYHVARLPQPGETLTGTSFQQMHGGKGANQAVAAARLACGNLQSSGARIAIITLGAQGCVVCTESGIAQHVPSFPVTAVDSTAAGDAFAGALGFCLAQGQSVLAAIRFASAAGALASTRHGAQPAMPRPRSSRRSRPS